MTIYYVNGATGSDGNAGTSAAAAWATIDKALTTISSAGSHQVVVAGNQTYVENSGSGYLVSTTVYTSDVTFICDDYDHPAVIKGTSGLRSVYLTGSKIRWEGFEFQSSSTNSSGLINIASTGSDYVFRRCRFRWVNVTSGAYYLVSINGTAVSNIRFDDCEFISAGTVGGLYLDKCSGIYLSNCNIRCSVHGASTYGVRMQGEVESVHLDGCTVSGTVGFYQQEATVLATQLIITNTKLRGRTYAALFIGGSVGELLTVVLNNCSAVSEGQGVVAQSYCKITVDGVNSVSENQAIAIPGDGAYVNCTGKITKSSAVTHDAGTGHAILVGDGGVNCVIKDCHANGSISQYGIVLKGTGHLVDGNTVYGGSLDGIYLKGCADSIVQNNTIVQATAGGYGIEIIDNTIDSTDNIITGNVVVCTNGQLFRAESGLAAGNVVDANEYHVLADATWGNVLGTAITSLSTMQAAWASYIPTNDSTSSEDSLRLIISGIDPQLSSLSSQVTTVDTVVDANAAAIATIGSDLDIDGYTLEEAMRIALAALAGKVSGGGTTTNTFKAADDSKARITATVDSDGNRIGITVDAT